MGNADTGDAPIGAMKLIGPLKMTKVKLWHVYGCLWHVYGCLRHASDMPQTCPRHASDDAPDMPQMMPQTCRDDAPDMPQIFVQSPHKKSKLPNFEILWGWLDQYWLNTLAWQIIWDISFSWGVPSGLLWEVFCSHHSTWVAAALSKIKKHFSPHMSLVSCDAFGLEQWRINRKEDFWAIIQG